MADFTKDEIVIGDLEINDDRSGVSSYIETWFDADKKFGTNVNNDCDSWVNFYAEYFPESRELKCEYFVDTPYDNKCYSYIPTEKEKELIVSLMEEYCQKEENMSISEFIESVNNDINMSL